MCKSCDLFQQKVKLHAAGEDQPTITTSQMELTTMLRSSNITPSGGGEEKTCIVNDQMGPFIALYILILAVGLPGSLLSVWGFIQSRRSQQKQSAYVYLVNLLVADILLLFALPFKILKDLGAAPWKLMVFHCQASGVIIYISLYASIAFLAFIIVDRYLEVEQDIQ